MRKRLTFILIFSSFLSYGQEYAWWFTSKKFLRDTPSRENYKYIYRATANDNLGTLVMGPTDAEEPKKYYRISKNLLPIKVNGYAFMRDTNGVWCSFNKTMEVNKFEYLLGGNISTMGLTSPAPYYIECIDKLTKDVDELLRFHFYSIVLPYYAQPTDANRALEDKLFKSPENTFLEDVIQVPTISWQYNYNDQGYKDFPDDIKHNFPMNATVEDILKGEIIQRNVPLRLKAILDTSIYAAGGKILPVVESDVISLNLIPSSPQLVDSDFAVINKSQCHYSSDAGFILNFKRDLNAAINEKMIITLYNNDDVLINQEITDVLTNNGDNTFSYKWVNPLDSDSYKVKYQTIYTDTNIPPEDSSWTSIVATEFIIPETIGLSFSITSKSDKDCFEINDGYIDVSADGEEGRTFLYQLKREGLVQFFNGTSWINYTGTNEEDDTWFAFTNAKTTRINKLNKGTYQVKVKDSQGCFAR